MYTIFKMSATATRPRGSSCGVIDLVMPIVSGY